MNRIKTKSQFLIRKYLKLKYLNLRFHEIKRNNVFLLIKTHIE